MSHSSSLLNVHVLFALLFSYMFGIIIILNEISADVLISDLHKIQKYGQCSFNTMVDAGANEGFFTKKLKKVFPDMKILAIEGNHDMKPKLDKIVHEFGNDGSIIVTIALLGNSSGSSVTYYNNPNAHTGTSNIMHCCCSNALIVTYLS